MKISILFEQYMPYHEYKDPGQIFMGLIESGINAEIITVKKEGLKTYSNKEVNLRQVTLRELTSRTFWVNTDADIVIVYTWLSGCYNDVLKQIRDSGKKIIIKADSDGLICYPLPSRYEHLPILKSKMIRSKIILTLSKYLPIKFFYARKAANILQEMNMADYIIIESPTALANVNYFLIEWNRADLVKKTYFVPNPVTSNFNESLLPKAKNNIVISSGRWSDLRQKNTYMFLKTLARFLRMRPDYTSIIFGPGSEIISSMVKNDSYLRDRIKIYGFVDRSKIPGLLSISKIFYIPSLWEGLPISACEAVYMGCSIVGTPLGGLCYLAMQGSSGTISSNFTEEALLAALLQDSVKWDKHYYDSEKISSFWRDKLSKIKVARDIIDILT